VSIKHHNILHYLLVMLLIVAPLRSVFAMQAMVCEDMSTELQQSRVTDSALPTDHCRTMMPVAGAAPAAGLSAQSYNTCCHDDGACKSDCHFTMSVSLPIYQGEYTAVLFGTETLDADSTILVVRELNPPFRPPLSL